jgi:hypothetical protein
MIYYAGSRGLLEVQFWEQLGDECDIIDFVRCKIDLLLHPGIYASCDYQQGNQIPRTSDGDSPLAFLTAEHRIVTWQIIDDVIQNTHQRMFQQGSAWTEKNVYGNTVTAALQSHGKNCLIYSTTGMAAVRYSAVTAPLCSNCIFDAFDPTAKNVFQLVCRSSIQNFSYRVNKADFIGNLLSDLRSLYFPKR